MQVIEQEFRFILLGDVAPDLVKDQLWFLGVHTVVGALHHEQLCIGHLGGDELGVFYERLCQR